MRSSPRSRLPSNVKQPRRPIGVAIMAILGVLGSLLAVAYTLIRLWGLLVTIELSRPLGLLGGALVVALFALRVNWGFWELVRWAWWANLLLTLLGVAGLITAVRYVPAIAALLAQLRPNLDARALSSAVLTGLAVSLAYHLIAVIYMISVHAAFGVAVKDERPVWERLQRQ